MRDENEVGVLATVTVSRFLRAPQMGLMVDGTHMTFEASRETPTGWIYRRLLI